MMIAFLSRWSWLAASLGGFVYLLLQVVIETNFPEHWAGSPSRFLSLSYAGWSRLLWLPSALLLTGLSGIFTNFSKWLGRLGKLGYFLAVIGFGMDILGNWLEFWLFGWLLVPFVGEFWTGSAGSQLGYSTSSYGALFLGTGLLVFGITALRSSLHARWGVLLIALGLVYISIIFFFFAGLLIVHALIYGSTWILIGFRLRNELPAEPLISFTGVKG